MADIKSRLSSNITNIIRFVRRAFYKGGQTVLATFSNVVSCTFTDAKVLCNFKWMGIK